VSTVPNELSLAEARRLAVAAQGLHPVHAPAATPAAVLNRLGCVQIDSMSAVRRSHELVLLSRSVSLEDAAGVGTLAAPGLSFEGMAHALSLITVDLWPAFGFRRRRILRDGWRGPEVDRTAVARAQDRLRAEGQVRPRDFGAATGKGWERDSPYRWALEWLAATGGAVCGHRDRWERVYSLPELVISEPLRRTELSDGECVQHLCRRAVDALGLATAKDVADYFRLRPAEAQAGLAALGLEQATVSGWRDPVWLSPRIDQADKVDEDAVTALSPFDSLVWTRERQLRLFGKDYRLEAYKPAGQRTFGYFSLPVLRGCEVVGRVALRRRDRTLVVENVELDAGAPASTMSRAIDGVSRWTACDTVSYEGPLLVTSPERQ
jgi:uncharacterized protein